LASARHFSCLTITMRLLLRLRLLTLFVLPALLNAALPAWPHEQSDLKPDPRITFGRLENGFRYMVMPNAKPAGRVTLYLLVQAGSFHENDDERGLAHFVEHMVFNGSRDFPGDATIRTLQRLGLGFGPHFNADTQMLQTCYHLRDLPTEDPGAITTSLKIFRNFADGALFTADAVAKERKVILAELRARSGQVRLTSDRELEFLDTDQAHGSTYNQIDDIFAETRISSRLDPSGKESIIKKATPKKLRAFYERWYRPERMILAIVGDIDPATILPEVEKTFASFQARTPPPAEPVAGEARVLNNSRLVLTHTSSTSATQVHVSLASALPRTSIDTAARRAAELPGLFALSCIRSRLAETTTFPAEFDYTTSHAIPGWHLPMLQASTPKKHLQETMIALVTEMRRAQQHGFSSEELADRIQSFRARADEDERDAANRTSAALAQTLAYAAARGVVVPAPREDRRLIENALAGVTSESCLTAARELWKPYGTFLSAVGNYSPRDLTDTIGLALEQAWEMERDVRAPDTVGAFPYDDFGPAGKIVSERHDETLDCWFLQFENGVRFTFKRTSYEANQVSIDVCFGDGGRAAARRGFGLAVGTVFIGGLSKIPFEKMASVFLKAGASMNWSISANERCYRFGTAMDAKTLPLTLKLVTASLTDPAFRESADAKLRALFEPQFAAEAQTAASVANRKLLSFLHGGHRFASRPTVEETRAVSFVELRDYIQPQLLQSPLEITLVGDISREDATAWVAKTLGALPARPAVDAQASAVPFTPPQLPHRETIRFVGKTEVATVLLSWRGPDEPGTLDDCRADLLATILEDRLRLKIRQELGAAYSPSALHMTHPHWTPAMRTVVCQVETDPKKVTQVSKALHAMIAALVSEGITAEELERARPPLIKIADESLQNNAWWRDSLKSAQSQPQFLTGLVDPPAHYRALTLAELNDFVRTLLISANSCEIHAIPQ
jgi:zinc protease